MKDTIGFKVVYDWIFENHGGMPKTIEDVISATYSDLVARINKMSIPKPVEKIVEKPKTPKEEIAQALELLNKNVKEADLKAAISALTAKVK